MLECIVRGRRELDAIEAQWLCMVGEYTRSGAWQADGFLSAAAAIQQRCRMDAGAARAAVNLAKALHRLPATEKAFDAGEISRAHAAVIANAYTEERAERLAEIEAGLVELAKKVDPSRCVPPWRSTRMRSTVTVAPATTRRRTRRTGSTPPSSAPACR